jgi:hypothetical protein
MKLKLSCTLCIASLVLTTGCASVNDNPYYQSNYSRAYIAQNVAVPMIEGFSRNTVLNASYLFKQNMINTGAYALESNPFRSYTNPIQGRGFGQTDVNGFLYSH